jgi:DNA-binding beta-propeller fold protein YncE
VTGNATVAAPQAGGSVPASTGQPAGAAAPPVAPPVDAEARRRRRRRAILVILLGLLVAVFLGIALWYLIFRRPLPLPIPPGPQDQAPTYAFSIYDLTRPLSVAASTDGDRIYVTQSDGTQETVVLDGRGHLLGVLAPPATITTHATQLYVAVDPTTGKVYASDRLAGQVYVYGADGTYERRFTPPDALSGWQPLALAFDAHGNLYVSDAGGTIQRVHEFAPDGTLVRDFGTTAGLDFPNGIAVDDAGNVYVSDTNAGRLLVFGPTGAQVGVIGRGPAAGELGLPVGIAIDGSKRVFVVDSVAHSVQIYDVIAAGARSPSYLTSFGAEGTADGGFEYPNGVSVDGHGRVYVADWNNDRVQVWSY